MFNANGNRENDFSEKNWVYDHIVKVDNGHEVSNYRIVHDNNHDLFKGKLGHSSKLAKAILKHASDEPTTLKVESPTGYGTLNYKLLSHRLVDPSYKGKKITRVYHDPLQEEIGTLGALGVGAGIIGTGYVAGQAMKAVLKATDPFEYTKKQAAKLNRKEQEAEIERQRKYDEDTRKIESNPNYIPINKVFKPDSKIMKQLRQQPIKEGNKVKQYAVFSHKDGGTIEHINSFHDAREAHDHAKRYSGWHGVKTFVTNLFKGDKAEGIYQGGKNMKPEHYINESLGEITENWIKRALNIEPGKINVNQWRDDHSHLTGQQHLDHARHFFDVANNYEAKGKKTWADRARSLGVLHTIGAKARKKMGNMSEGFEEAFGETILEINEDATTLLTTIGTLGGMAATGAAVGAGVGYLAHRLRKKITGESGEEKAARRILKAGKYIKEIRIPGFVRENFINEDKD